MAESAGVRSSAHAPSCARQYSSNQEDTMSAPDGHELGTRPPTPIVFRSSARRGDGLVVVQHLSPDFKSMTELD
jgi:hypothetical protein